MIQDLYMHLKDKEDISVEDAVRKHEVQGVHLFMQF